jgi:hypothetical protein
MALCGSRQPGVPTEPFWKCWQEDIGTDTPEKRLIMKDLRSSELPRLMTTAEVASVLRVDRSTLSRWRSSGLGPRVTWLSSSSPRYQRDDVVEWLRRADA